MSALRKTAEVLKLQNDYQMEKLRVSMAYDKLVGEEVERWLAGNRTVADCDFLPEMKRHNKRVIDINRRRDNHLKALKDLFLASCRVLKLQKQGLA